MGTTSSADFIYIFGGTDDNNTKRAEVYSAYITLTGGITAWVPQPSLPAARTGAAAAIYPIEGTNTSVIYAIGGAGHQRLLHQYDLSGHRQRRHRRADKTGRRTA